MFVVLLSQSLKYQVAQANLKLTKFDLKLLILLSLPPYVIPSVGVIGRHLHPLFPCGESKSLGFPSSLTKLIFPEGPTHHTVTLETPNSLWGGEACMCGGVCPEAYFSPEAGPGCC